MFIQDCYQEVHLQFGIDEVYVINGLSTSTLDKLRQRAELTLDATDTIVKNNVSCDMILLFHKKRINRSLIYRFLEHLKKNPSKEADFKNLYTLNNPDELFEHMKSRNYVLVCQKSF